MRAMLRLRYRRVAAITAVLFAAAGGIATAAGGNVTYACNGADGKDGTNGTNGSNGADGTSVSSLAVAAGDANCPNGGSKFTAAGGNVTYACNGAGGNGPLIFSGEIESGGLVFAGSPGITVTLILQTFTYDVTLPAGTFSSVAQCETMSTTVTPIQPGGSPVPAVNGTHCENDGSAIIGIQFKDPASGLAQLTDFNFISTVPSS